MRKWLLLVGSWCIVDAVLLGVFPQHVGAWLALDHYLGDPEGHTVRYAIIAVFLLIGFANLLVAIPDGGSRLPFFTLSACFTWTIAWTALGFLVAMAGFGDYGRLTLYVVWLIVQSERLQFAWILPEQIAEVRSLLNQLRQQRQELERHSK